MLDSCRGKLLLLALVVFCRRSASSVAVRTTQHDASNTLHSEPDNLLGTGIIGIILNVAMENFLCKGGREVGGREGGRERERKRKRKRKRQRETDSQTHNA